MANYVQKTKKIRKHKFFYAHCIAELETHIDNQNTTSKFQIPKFTSKHSSPKTENWYEA